MTLAHVYQFIEDNWSLCYSRKKTFMFH